MAYYYIKLYFKNKNINWLPDIGQEINRLSWHRALSSHRPAGLDLEDFCWPRSGKHFLWDSRSICFCCTPKPPEKETGKVKPWTQWPELHLPPGCINGTTIQINRVSGTGGKNIISLGMNFKRGSQFFHNRFLSACPCLKITSLDKLHVLATCHRRFVMWFQGRMSM